MPTLEDVRFDPKARKEARTKLRGMRDEHLLEVITVQKEESRRATQRRRSRWEDDWRLYQSEVDWSDKEEWQSKVWVPMPFSAVEQATGIIRRSMLDSAEFFGIEGTEERDKRLAASVWKPVLKLAMTKAKFVQKFADATKVGFACGPSLYIKFRWPSFVTPSLAGVEMDPKTGEMLPVYAEKRRSFLAIDTIPPWQVYRDPVGSKPREQWSGAYIMHEEYVDRGYFTQSPLYRNTERLRGSAGAGAALSGAKDSGPDAVARRKQDTWEPHKFRHPILATEWYGDVPDPNGDLVYPDAMMIRGDDVLVFGPKDNPLWAVDPSTGRRKWPLIGFSPIGHPMRFDGFGILSAVTPLAMLFSNLFNLFSDGLNWEVNVPTELDLTVLDDLDDTEHIPGKLWIKNGPGRALQPAEMGKMNAGTVLAALQFVHQQFENESFVTAFAQGLPGSRTNITKGEVQLKTAQSMGIFEAMARELEAGGTAAVELAFDFLHQYLTDWSDPSLAEIIGPANVALLQSMSMAERMKTLGGNFDYTFSGVSAALQKADMLGRLMQAAQLAQTDFYRGLTNPSEVLGSIFDILGLRDRIQIHDRPVVPVDQVQAALQAAGIPADLLGALGAGPGGGGAAAPTMQQLEPTADEIGASADLM